MSSFEQTMMGRSPQCYIPSCVEIAQLVPEKIFQGFLHTVYGHGGHLGHVTNIILMYFHSMYLKVYTQNLVKNGQVVSEKSMF